MLLAWMDGELGLSATMFIGILVFTGVQEYSMHTISPGASVEADGIGGRPQSLPTAQGPGLCESL